MASLGVNIDHVATVRQARRTIEPDPVWAAALAELAGARVITVHLREDRRHIQDRDVRVLKQTVQVKLNLEMAAEQSVTDFALEVLPHQATVVPEKREELTTEGGLDVVGNFDRVRRCVDQLHAAGIIVSLFIDPSVQQIEATKSLGCAAVELHTGRYADATSASEQEKELRQLERAGEFVRRLGLELHFGHGLTYRNVQPVAAIPDAGELNIGHSIVARSIMVGFSQAVREMRELIEAASRK